MGIARYLCKRTRGSSCLDPPRGAVPFSRTRPTGRFHFSERTRRGGSTFEDPPHGAVPFFRTRPAPRPPYKGLSLSDGPEEGFSGSALLSDKKRKQNTVPENGVSNSVEGTR